MKKADPIIGSLAVLVAPNVHAIQLVLQYGYTHPMPRHEERRAPPENLPGRVTFRIWCDERNLVADLGKAAWQRTWWRLGICWAFE
jgi:hypothetical protein